MNAILEELKRYLNETSQEQLAKDWDATQKYDKVGPTIYEFKKTHRYIIKCGASDPLLDSENFYTFIDPKNFFGFSFLN